MNTTLALVARGTRGCPLPEAVLVLTILFEVTGGLMLIANWNAKYAAWGLAAFTLVAGSIFHAFWHAQPRRRANEFNFLRNIAIVGGLMLVAALPDRDVELLT